MNDINRQRTPEVRLVFIGQRNYFTEFFVDWLVKNTTVVGVIWTCSDGGTLKAKALRLLRRLRRRGPLRVAGELLWYMTTKYVYVKDVEDLRKLVRSLRRSWDVKCRPQLPTLSVPNLRGAETMSFLSELKSTIILTQCINEIIPAELYSFPPLGAYVFHEGIVPQYRGKFCTHWAIMNGDYDCIGASLIRVEAGIDRGAIAFTEHVWPDARNRGRGWLEHHTLLLAFPRLRRWLSDVANGSLELRKQTAVYPIYSYPTIGHLIRARRCKEAYEHWRAECVGRTQPAQEVLTEAAAVVDPAEPPTTNIGNETVGREAI